MNLWVRGFLPSPKHYKVIVLVKIKKIVLNSKDLNMLKKHKSLRVGNFRINVDDSFSIPEVKFYGKFKF